MLLTSSPVKVCLKVFKQLDATFATYMHIYLRRELVIGLVSSLQVLQCLGAGGSMLNLNYFNHSP